MLYRSRGTFTKLVITQLKSRHCCIISHIKKFQMIATSNFISLKEFIIQAALCFSNLVSFWLPCCMSPLTSLLHRKHRLPCLCKGSESQMTPFLGHASLNSKTATDKQTETIKVLYLLLTQGGGEGNQEHTYFCTLHSYKYHTCMDFNLTIPALTL